MASAKQLAARKKFVAMIQKKSKKPKTKKKATAKKTYTKKKKG